MLRDVRRRTGRVLDPPDLPGIAAGAALQIVKVAIDSNLQVHRRRQAGGKIGNGGARRIEHLHPSAAIIGEEVFAEVLPRKFDDCRVVKRSASDSAPY